MENIGLGLSEQELMGQKPLNPEQNEKTKETEWRIKDFKGMFHFHSAEGSPCGRDSLREIKSAIMAKTGLKYIGITEHTAQPAQDYRWPDKLLQEFNEIDQLNQEPGPHLFKGIELDALSDGTVNAYPRLIDQSDIVIASIHYKYLEPELMTGEATLPRLINVMKKYPQINVLGHLLRDLPEEEVANFDWDHLFKEAKANQVIVEINMSEDHYSDMPQAFFDALVRNQILVAFTPDFHGVTSYLDSSKLSAEDLAYLKNYNKLIAARNRLGFSGSDLRRTPNNQNLTPEEEKDQLEILEMYEAELKRMQDGEELARIYDIISASEKMEVEVTNQNDEIKRKTVDQHPIPARTMFKYARIIYRNKKALEGLSRDNIVNLWGEEQFKQWLVDRKKQTTEGTE